MNTAAARAEFLAVMRRLEPEPPHVLHVARLALRMFDELAVLHRLSDEERLLLEAAACLHDLGWSVAPDGAKHHKESARLIRAQRWENFSAAQVEMIALIARYHRKSPPKLEHEDFAALNAEDRSKVSRLAALLRVADGLDRRHLQRVNDLAVRISGGKVVVTLDSRDPVDMEIAAAQKKADLFGSVFERELEFRHGPRADCTLET